MTNETLPDDENRQLMFSSFRYVMSAIGLKGEEKDAPVDECMRIADEYCSYLLKAQEQRQWIDVTKEKPNDYQHVLVLLENGEFFKAMYCDDVSENGSWHSEYFKFNPNTEITHWMPLPNHPNH